MNDTTVRLLEELAQRLQTTVEHLWSVLVRQAYVSALTQGLACIIAVVVLVAGWRFVTRTWTRVSQWEDRWAADELRTALCIGGIAVGVMLSMFLLLSVPEVITKILNPEYWALQQVLNAVGR